MRMDTLLSLPEAAQRLALRDVRTVRRALASRGLPVVRLGRTVRVREQDITALLRGSTSVDSSPRALPAPFGRMAGRARPEPAMSKPARRRRKETIAPNVYREHSATCLAQDPDDPTFRCPCPQSWREKVLPGLYRDHAPTCAASSRLARVRGCLCPFSCPSYPNSSGSTRIRAATYTAAEAEFRRRRTAHDDAKMSKRRGMVLLKPMSADDMFAEMLVRSTTINVGSERTYENQWALHHSPVFGHWPVDSLEEAIDALQEHANGLVDLCMLTRRATGRFRPNFISDTWMPLNSLLAYATTQRRWSRNPAKLITVPATPLPGLDEDLKMPRTHTNVLAYEEIVRIYDWLREQPGEGAERYAVAIWTAFEWCLRRGELRGLLVGDIDPVAGIGKMEWQVDDAGRRRRPKNVKPHDPVSEFPMSDVLRAGLSRVLAAHPAGRVPSACLFHDVDPFRPIVRDRLGQHLHAAQVALKITTRSGENLTVHGLRHSGLTHLRRAGMTSWEVREWGRHKDERTTRLYVNGLGPAALQRAAAAFGRP
jgi:excisionase family DNA binding protein